MKIIPSLTTIFLIVFILFTYHFPDYYAYTRTPPNYSYSGQASWFDPWDINVYVAAITWGQKKHILLKNLYTTTPYKSSFIYPVYTTLGYVFSNINPFLIFHFSSILAGILLCLTLFFSSRVFLKNNYLSLLAVLLISLGGGFGWISQMNYPSSDLFMTSFTFSSAFQRPHEAIGISVYLISLTAFYIAVIKNKKIHFFLSLLSALFLIFIYPYYLVSYGLICALLVLGTTHQSKKNFWYFLIIMILATLTAAFYYIHLKSTCFGSLTSQELKTPGLIYLITGYGVFLPIFIYNFFTLKVGQTERLFLSFWFIASFLLAFLPIGIARFYLRTLFFPLVILTLIALSTIAQKIKVPLYILIASLCIISTISSFYVFYRRIAEVEQNNVFYYIPKEIVTSFRFLKEQNKDGLLSGYTLGNYLPPYTGKSVYMGHLIQTSDSGEKLAGINAFYSKQFSYQEARDFLKQNNIQLIVYGEEEKKMGKLTYDFLRPVFSNEKITIFDVH